MVFLRTRHNFISLAYKINRKEAQSCKEENEELKNNANQGLSIKNEFIEHIYMYPHFPFNAIHVIYFGDIGQCITRIKSVFLQIRH